MLHNRTQRFQKPSKYFEHTSINKISQIMLYLLYHFLEEICTIHLLVKQNEIFLNNMQSNPQFESLLHIIFKGLSFLVPITLLLFF